MLFVIVFWNIAFKSLVHQTMVWESRTLLQDIFSLWDPNYEHWFQTFGSPNNGLREQDLNSKYLQFMRFNFRVTITVYSSFLSKTTLRYHLLCVHLLFSIFKFQRLNSKIYEKMNPKKMWPRNFRKLLKVNQLCIFIVYFDHQMF